MSRGRGKIILLYFETNPSNSFEAAGSDGREPAKLLNTSRYNISTRILRRGRWYEESFNGFGAGCGFHRRLWAGAGFAGGEVRAHPDGRPAALPVQFPQKLRLTGFWIFDFGFSIFDSPVVDVILEGSGGLPMQPQMTHMVADSGIDN